MASNYKQKKPHNKAIFIISLDTELLWGKLIYGIASHSYDKSWFKDYKNINAILNLFEKYKIKGTWAVVGHLFLDRCDKEHKDIKSSQKWNYCCKEVGPLLNAKPMINMIKTCKVKQEIACHGFSHYNFKKSPNHEMELTDEEALSELEACKKLAEKEGITLKSFVFPQEKHAKYSILQKAGFKCYRKAISSVENTKYKRLKSFYNLIKGVPSKPSRISKVAGLVEIEANCEILPFNKKTTNFILAPLFKRYNLNKLSKSLDVSINEKMIFHIWVHPIGFSNQQDIDQLDSFLNIIHQHIKQGNIISMTMSEVAKKYGKKS